jgi:enediyne biosynthesis protein E4
VKEPATFQTTKTRILLAFGISLAFFYDRIGFSDGPVKATVSFREAAVVTGLDFHHFIGATGEFFFPENMGAGVALIDYDRDGDLDVYLLQGVLLDKTKRLADALFPPSKDHWPGNRLFRNDLRETGKLHFTDVTAQAGVGFEGYGMGAAVGDYDNDGYPDLYVTNFGHNVLYHNNGNGTFTDVTEQAGADDPRWSTSAAFLDYDNDGDLDLMLVNYVDFTIKGNRQCPNVTGERDYCAPSVYQPLPGRLFRNEGNGKFKDVTEAAGIGATFGRGLGLVCADFNLDGWVDIFVANDGSANQLWVNQGNGTFEDKALFFGCAYNSNGVAEAGMGVTAGDFDNDGDEDVFITHLTAENHTLFVNDGTGVFSDRTVQSGLAAIPNYTGFGTEWFDYDNDGNLDLFVANGSVHILPSLRGEPYPYHQRNQLFHNEGNGRFREAADGGGRALQLSEVSRGAAFGDIDNDGDVDIVVANNNGPARLLLNETDSRSHWLEVRLVGVKTNRDGIGSMVGVLRKARPTLWRRVHTDGSYLSANDARVHFGLGADPRIDAIVVRWLGGHSEIWNDLRADHIIVLREGSGKPFVTGEVHR